MSAPGRTRRVPPIPKSDKPFRAFCVMLEPKHLATIEAIARQQDTSKAGALRYLIENGLTLARTGCLRPRPGRRAYHSLERPKSTHIRLPKDIYARMQDGKQAQGMRLGEFVRLCIEKGRP